MQKIMFNDRYGLTDAVLTGKKTQTRRLCKNQNRHLVDAQYFTKCKDGMFEYKLADFDNGITEYSKYGIGEVIAVAQSYSAVNSFYREAVKYKHSIRGQLVTEFDCLSMKDINNWFYGILPAIRNSAGWNNKMFVKSELMPHHIRINEIRYERLQDISDEDCFAEGVHLLKSQSQYYVDNLRKDFPKSSPYGSSLFNSPREAYAALIDSINGKCTWERNPYVVVYEFEKVD